MSLRRSAWPFSASSEQPPSLAHPTHYSYSCRRTVNIPCRLIDILSLRRCHEIVRAQPLVVEEARSLQHTAVGAEEALRCRHVIRHERRLAAGEAVALLQATCPLIGRVDGVVGRRQVEGIDLVRAGEVAAGGIAVDGGRRATIAAVGVGVWQRVDDAAIGRDGDEGWTASTWLDR